MFIGNKSKLTEVVRMMLVAIIFGASAFLLLRYSSAAAPAVLVEAEQGSMTGNVQRANDALASGMATVKFGSRSTVPAADSFVDSICVNTHWNYADTPYGRDYPVIRDRLVASGIRYTREGGTDDLSLSRLAELQKLGIKFVIIIDGNSGTRPSTAYWSNPPNYLITDFIKKIGAQSVVAVEGPNEIDLFSRYWRIKPGDTETLNTNPSSPQYWAKFLPGYMNALNQAVKSDPVTANIPIYGPALTTVDAYNAAGNMGNSVDFANTHWYLGGRHPETTGWGDNGYGSLTWVQKYLAGVEAPNKPIVATEGGYSNAVNQNKGNIPESIEASYMPRLFFTAFAGNIQRFCKYEFVDESADPGKTDSEQNFGLLRNDLSEKPAYVVIKNLITLLKDSGPAFATSNLDFTLSGANGDTKSQLMQKRDGSYWLAVWQATELWDPNNGDTKPMPSLPLKLLLKKPASQLDSYVPRTGTASVGSAVNTSTFSFNSTGDVTLIRIKP